MVGRRSVLAGVGSLLIAGGTAASLGTDAFTSTVASRPANVSTADDPANALLGTIGQGLVKKNAKEAMTEFLNNSSDTMTITVALDNAADGTLYDNEGGSGSSVSFTIESGHSHIVDIEAAVTGTITYSVTVSSPSLSLETSGSVESESGNVKGAVLVQKPSKDNDFTADELSQQFQVKSVDVRDNDGDADLDRVEFRVREGGSSGTVVGSLDVTDPDPSRYNPKGNPAVSFSPDFGHLIQPSTTYSLTVTGYDTDGNFELETVEDTT